MMKERKKKKSYKIEEGGLSEVPERLSWLARRRVWKCGKRFVMKKFVWFMFGEILHYEYLEI